MAESQRSAKESHSSVSSSGEASGGQTGSPQSSLALSSLSKTSASPVVAVPPSSLSVSPNTQQSGVPSSSDTSSPLVQRAHNVNSATTLPDSDGETKQESAAKQSKLTKSFLARFRQKNAEMHKIFPDLPKTEKLIDDYSCALHREILAQGRMYVTQSYLCFYANIFTWETLLMIPLNRIQSLTKEKRALLFPTAIHIATATEKYGFSSFIQRDVSYQILFRLWQNALLNQPLSTLELYKIARKSWGDPYHFNTEDDTWGSPQPLTPSLSRAKSELLDDAREDLLMVPGDSEGKSPDSFKRQALLESGGEPPSSDSSPPRLRAHSLPEGHVLRTGVPGRQVSSQDKEFQPHSLTTIDVTMVTAAKTTATANNGGVRERKGSDRGRVVSTLPPFPGDNGNNSGAAAAAYAGAVGGASRQSPHQGLEQSGNSGTVGDTDSCLSHPVLIIRDGMDNHSVSESFMSSEFETTSFPDQGEVLCGCEIHEGCTVINDVYDGDLETVFQVLFTDSEFMRGFLHSRGTTNIDFGEWLAHVDGSRVRDVKYTLALNYSFGPKYSPSTERQVYSKVSQPGVRHIVESEVCNGNVPYNDKFYTCVRVCMTRVTHNQTRIRVTSNIAFRKNCWGVVKNLIERNVGDGLRSHYAHLDMTLKEHVASLALKKKVPHKPSSRRARKQRRQQSAVPWEASESPIPPPRAHSRKPSLTSVGGGGGGGGGGVSFGALYPAPEIGMEPAPQNVSTHSSQDNLLYSNHMQREDSTPPQLTNRFTVWLLLFVAFLVVCNMGLYYWLMRYQPVVATGASSGQAAPKIDQWPTTQEGWRSFVQDIQHGYNQRMQGYELLVTELLDALKQMQTDLGRYHESTSELLQKARKDVPFPATVQPQPSSQEGPSTRTTQKVKLKTEPTGVPRDDDGHEEL